MQYRVERLSTPNGPQQDDDDGIAHQSQIRPSSPTQHELQGSPCARLSGSIPPASERNELYQEAETTEPRNEDERLNQETKRDFFMKPGKCDSFFVSHDAECRSIVGTQASPYLQSRCPACFGKELLHDSSML